MKKNKVPFKLKISAWYGFFMVLLLSLILFLVYTTSASNLIKQTEEKIDHTIIDSIEYVEYQNGIFEFNDNLNEFEEISVLIYDEYGNILFGTPPKRFNVDYEFKQGLNSMELPNNNEYLFKDEFIQLDNAPFEIVIRVIATYTSVNLTLRSFMMTSLILGPLGLLIAIIGGYRLMNTIFKPIDEISDMAKKISQDTDLSLRIPDIQNSDELGNLVTRFNDMLKQLEYSFEREKQFTQDISHELRTPLTSLKLDVEMLEMDQKYDDKLIKRMLNQIDNMTFLIESMSESTQAIQNINKEQIHLKDFLEEISEDYINPIHIFILDDQKVFADKNLLKRIFTNLLNNSFQYGASMVKIYYNQSNELIIEDDGKGIREENLHRIWDRFYQEETSRTENTLGLGLYFVKEAIQAHLWNIDVESKENSFTRFIITTS